MSVLERNLPAFSLHVRPEVFRAFAQKYKSLFRLGLG